MAKSEKGLSALDKAIAQAMGEERTIGKQDDPAQQRWPNLWKWMTTLYIGKDRLKAPANLSIRMGPDGVIVNLSDRDLCVGFTVACDYLENAIDAIEVALASPNPPMNNYGKKEPQLRKRRTT